MGEKLVVPLIAQSGHDREEFLLNVTRSPKIEAKMTYQTRARKTIILARLDFGVEHRNPDGMRIGSPHLHIYKEGFGDKWAYELPHKDYDIFNGAQDTSEWFDRFLDFCKIERNNVITGGTLI